MGLLSSYLARARHEVVSAYIHGDVLDVGCQYGQLRDRHSGQIGRYVGVDVSESAVDEARQRHPDCAFYVLDIDEAPLEFEAEFDTIVMMAVIEHIFNLKHLGRNLARALKPGGRAVLTTPTPFGNDVVHRFGAALGLFSKAAADDHIVLFNRKRFQIFAAEVGLVLLEHRLFQIGCNQLAVLQRPANREPAIVEAHAPGHRT